MNNFYNVFQLEDKIADVARTSPVTLYVFIVAIIIILAVGAYMIFRPRAKDVTVIGPFVLSNMAKPDSISTVFSQSQINNSLGNNFSLSFFVYMDGVNRENIPIAGPKGDFRFKPFLYILGVGDILLDPIHQVARIRIKPLRTKGLIEAGEVTSIDVDNFMIARWNQITLTMEGRTVDVYINGALAKSALLDNLPILNPVGVLLETSPDFSGQAGLFQAWPQRLTESQVVANYKRNTDVRGKPLIPDTGMKWSDVWSSLGEQFCKIGICGIRLDTGPLQYIDYEFA